MKRIAITLGTCALLALAWLAPTAASAAEPPEFNGGYVIDDTSAGVLGSEVGDLEGQVRAFAQEHGVQLFVVYVDEFSSPADPEQWGAATAQKNFLGDDGVLLSVAVQDRLFDLNAAENLVSDAQYETLTSEYVRPALKDSDWSGAITATLDGLENTVVNPPAGGSGTGTVVAVVGGVVVVGGIAAGVTIARRTRKRAAQQAGEAPALTLDELEAQASGLLVRVDDDLRSSEQELGFAQAQFGEAVAEPFSAAIAAARAQLQSAFQLRQKLDDHLPDSDEDRRAWLEEIIQNCTAAKESLDTHTESFSRLREVEQRAPEVLARVQAQLAEVSAGLNAAEATVAALAAEYADSVVGPLRAGIEEGATRLRFVAECVDSATRELGSGDNAAAAVTLRAAEAALEQARLLAAAPERQRGELAEGTRQLEAAYTDLRSDLQLAGQFAATATEADRQAMRAAAQQVTAVLEAGAQGDPVRALAAAAAANVQIDSAIGAAREAAERHQRAAAARDEALASARAEVLAAEQFIETRRGAIGAQARTRMSEARRQLEVAEQVAESDPNRSYQSALQASQYARAAYQLASSDVNGWGGPGGGGTWGGSGGTVGGGANGSFGGAVLGGILGGILSGGGSGSSGGSWSGSSGGFRGGWNGGGSIGRGSSGGGGRRGGGGRF